MRLIALTLILAGIGCSHTSTIRDYVERNLSAITTKQNLVGWGCSSNLYKFKFRDQGQDLSLVLKYYHDRVRCAREVAFLDEVSRRELSLSVIPKIYVRDADMSVVVMGRLKETLRAYLDRNKDRAYLGWDNDARRKIVHDLINGLLVLHKEGIVHGDLHLDNIMVQDGKIIFIDFGESFWSTDFTLDLLRLKHRVLSEIEDWEKLVDIGQLKNPGSFEVVGRIYKDPRISLVFWVANLFNAPSVQYWIYRLLRFTTDLDSLVSEYSSKIAGQAPSLWY